MNGTRAKACRRAVYGDGSRAAKGRRYAVRGNGQIVAADWQRREYQLLKRGVVGPHLAAKARGAVDEVVRAESAVSTGEATYSIRGAATGERA